MNANFKAIIEISDVLTGKVIDNLSDEEYMPLRIESYDGEYVCKVREAYKTILKELRMHVVQMYSLRVNRPIVLRT